MKFSNKFSKKRKALRPTSGKVKEALFNILRNNITMEGIHFLDLYAGTGAVGIEALREGASNVVFVEERTVCSKKINDCIKKLNTAGTASVFTKKVFSFIEYAELNQITFDIIFIDPPYHTEEIIHVLYSIDKSTILSQNGILIAEHFTKRQLPERFGKLHKIKDYHYGDTVLSFYKKASQKNNDLE